MTDKNQTNKETKFSNKKKIYFNLNRFYFYLFGSFRFKDCFFFFLISALPITLIWTVLKFDFKYGKAINGVLTAGVIIFSFIVCFPNKYNIKRYEVFLFMLKYFFQEKEFKLNKKNFINNKIQTIFFKINDLNIQNYNNETQKEFLNLFEKFYLTCYKQNITVNILKYSIKNDILEIKNSIINKIPMKHKKTLKKWEFQLINDLNSQKKEVIIFQLNINNKKNSTFENIKDFLIENFKNNNFMFDLKFLELDKINIFKNLINIDLNNDETIENNIHFLKINNSYYKILGLWDYGSEFDVNFLKNILYKFKYNREFFQFNTIIKNIPITETQTKTLFSNISRNFRQKILTTEDKDKNILDLKSTERYQYDFQELVSKVDEGHKFFNTKIFFIFKHTNKKKLQSITKSFINYCYLDNNILVNPFNFQQKNILESLTLFSSKSLNSNILQKSTYNIYKPQQFLTDSIVNFYPLSEETYNGKKSFLVGKNLSNNKHFFFSLHDQDKYKTSKNKNWGNKNHFILGASGSGKSFYVKKTILNLLKDDCKVLLFDPEKEYVKLTKEMKGENIELNNSLDQTINILQIFNFGNLNSNDLYLENHLNKVKIYFKTLIPDLSKMFLQILILQLQNLYKEFKITSYNKKKVSQYKPNQFPLIKHLYNKMKIFFKKKENLETFREEAKELFYLKEYTSDFNPFNQYTKIKFTNSLINLNLYQLTQSSQISPQTTLYFILLFEFIYSLLDKHRQENSKKTKKQFFYIFIDEAHVFLKGGDNTKNFILDNFYNLTKRVRKYSAGIVFTTQNIKDFIGGTQETIQKTEGIMNNCQHKTFFRLEPKDFIDLTEIFKNDSSFHTLQNTIKNLNIYEALWITTNLQNIHFKVITTKEEREIFTDLEN